MSICCYMPDRFSSEPHSFYHHVMWSEEWAGHHIPCLAPVPDSHPSISHHNGTVIKHLWVWMLPCSYPMYGMSFTLFYGSTSVVSIFSHSKMCFLTEITLFMCALALCFGCAQLGSWLFDAMARFLVPSSSGCYQSSCMLGKGGKRHLQVLRG